VLSPALSGTPPQSEAAVSASKTFDGFFEFIGRSTALATIDSGFSRQSCQSEPSILSEPPMRCAIWNTSGQRHRLQRLVLLNVRLENPKTIECQLPGFFRQPCQLVAHTRTVCQISQKIPCHTIQKMSHSPRAAGEQPAERRNSWQEERSFVFP
jgi:hypothetical protein